MTRETKPEPIDLETGGLKMQRFSANQNPFVLPIGATPKPMPSNPGTLIQGDLAMQEPALFTLSRLSSAARLDSQLITCRFGKHGTLGSLQNVLRHAIRQLIGCEPKTPSHSRR